MSDETPDVVRLGEDEALSFAPTSSEHGACGWAAYFSDAVEEAGAQVFARFAVAGNVRYVTGLPLVARDLLIRSGVEGANVTARLLRTLPVARMESAANQRAAHLGEADTATYPLVSLDVRIPTGMEAWARRPIAPGPDQGMPLKLSIPTDRKKPNSFYEQVAERFQWLASRGPRPASVLAEANEVPVTTVHRWVKEARRRGLLPSGQRGKG
ncbi:hypothetical protein [Streptosporangium sp. NPDC002524]|uniref:hypothetical protein n=1 Tax=Streptosporangium sp. NPDC002524 TaxID=3154537 RepID=UPI00332EB6A9